MILYIVIGNHYYISEESYIHEDVSNAQHNAQFSYWKQEYRLCELCGPHKEQKKYKKIESCWYRIPKLINDT